MPSIDPDIVRHALRVARERGFSEVAIQVGGASFSATLERVKTTKKPQTILAEVPEPEDESIAIKAPLVGYFRQPQAALAVGSIVQQGDLVGVVAALGLDNSIESPVSGEVIEVLVKDGEPVEYGQTLALLKVGA